MVSHGFPLAEGYVWPGLQFERLLVIHGLDLQFGICLCPLCAV